MPSMNTQKLKLALDDSNCIKQNEASTQKHCNLSSAGWSFDSKGKAFSAYLLTCPN